MDIDELLNRYFEGETSSEEERELRAFFTSGNVPDRLAVYTPMFAYLEEESRKERNYHLCSVYNALYLYHYNDPFLHW